MKIPNITRKLLVLLIAIIGVTGTVSAIFLTNFIVPSTVTITGAPGMTVIDMDKGGTLTALTWGDVQETTSSVHHIEVSDSGLTNIWLVDSTIPSIQSLTTNPNLPNGVHLSWDLDSKYLTTACNPAPAGVTGCALLTPGGTTSILTLTLSVDPTAALGSTSFQTVFAAYSTSSG
jgi:hypothetical protein